MTPTPTDAELIERLRERDKTILDGEMNRIREPGLVNPDGPEAANRLSALTAQIDELKAALEWYADKAAGCRKLTSEGDDARRLLDCDGGSLARRTLEANNGTN